MKTDTVSLLCSPGTRETLRLDSVRGADGTTQQVLVGVESGQKFPIHDGIPILLDESRISGFNQRYRKFYNRIAGLYDASMWLFARMAGGGEESFRMQYLSRLGVQDGARVLEVSIGTGTNIRFLPKTAACFGLDLSWGMLKRCQRNLNRWMLEAELILGNAEELPFRDELFDAVLHVGGINAFNDRRQAISEMIRVARGGTKIMIVDETAKMLQSISWAPTARKWLAEHAERFSAPVALVSQAMNEIEVTEIAGGNMYCLTFRKP